MSVAKRTTLVPNRNVMMTMDGSLPRSPVSVAMMPWDEPDPQPTLAQPPVQGGKDE